MKTAYKINIENPCQKINWSSMTNIEKGKFCTICTKNVFDFTNLTDIQIVNYLNQSDESICAKLDNSQLNRIISINQKSQIKHWHKIVASLIILSSSSNIYANENKHNYNQHLISKSDFKIKELSVINKIDSLKNVIKGHLIWESSKTPIKDIPIAIEGTEITSKTDSLGFFQLFIPENYEKNEIILIVIAEYGFEGQTKKIVMKSELPITNLVIEKENARIGEITFYKPKKWWQFWKKK